ncbi:MAG: periplasmic heavy metal sensor [Silicimonas sp.]|jgi:uncharacterized membrane protein|nr:periplasmic heavy metal sensor [Silicimonas sp.]
MTNETPTDPKKPRRWLMPALLVSAALNLLIVGIVAGALLSPDGPRRRGGEDERAVRGVLGEPFFRALPARQRREMVREIVGNRDAFREGREALRTRFESFLGALRAETFDREAAAALLGQQRQAAIRRQEQGEALLLDRLEGMTRDERAAYADALEERLKGFRRR